MYLEKRAPIKQRGSVLRIQDPITFYSTHLLACKLPIFSVQIILIFLTSLCIIQKLPANLISHPEFSFTTLVRFGSLY